MLSLAALLLLVVVLCSAAPTAGQASDPPASATLCVFTYWSPITVHGAFAARYFAASYPRTSFRVKALATPTLRDVVQQWLTNGSDCDYVGLGDTSSNAIAVSPLIPASVAWVDGSATATELSNSLSHPTFRRVIPTDAIGAGGAAVFAIAQGWDLANILCQDNAYGRSLAEGFASKFAALGGQVEYSRCFASNTDDDAAREIVTPIVENSATRVIFIAGESWRLETVFRELRVAETKILIFSESNCTTAELQAYPGSFCARYATMPARAQAYQTAFAARDTSVDASVFHGVLSPAEIADTPVETFWGAMGADAVHVGMEAIATFHTANRSRYPTLSDWVTAVRISTGLTGAVSFLPNGDRESATLAVFNLMPPRDSAVTVSSASTATFALEEVAVIDGDRVEPASASGELPSMWYAVDGGGFRSTPPAARTGQVGEGASTERLPTWAVAVLATVAVVSLVALVAVQAMRSSAGLGAVSLEHCPMDPEAPFTVFFVAVRNESTVRDLYPKDHPAAFAKIAAFVRAASRATRCHEARRINETTVMLVSRHPTDALQCASQILHACAQERWADTLQQADHEGHLHATDSASSAHNQNQQGPLPPRAPGTSPGAIALAVPKLKGGRTPRSGRALSSNRSGTRHRHSATTTASRRSAPTSADAYLSQNYSMPLVNIGVHTGFGAIDYDERAGTISYHGAVVDEAAHFTDAGVGGHIIVSEETAEAVLDAEDGRGVAGTFTAFRNVTPPIARGGFRGGGEPRANALQTFAPSDYVMAAATKRRIDDALLRADDVEPEEQGLLSGGIARTRADDSAGVSAALSAADSGLATKRIATVCIHVPALAPMAPTTAFSSPPLQHSRSADEIAPPGSPTGATTSPMLPGEHRAIVAQILQEVRDTAARRKAKVVAVADSRVYLTINGVGHTVARPETRAVLAALDLCVDAAFAVPALRGATAGVAVGRATVGEVNGFSVALGSITTSARLMQTAATFLGVPVLTSDACYDDIRSTFHSLTVDCAAVPLGVGPHPPTRLTRLLAVSEPRDGNAEGEWLYHVQAASPKAAKSRSRHTTQSATSGGGGASSLSLSQSYSMGASASLEASWASLFAAERARRAGTPLRSPNTEEDTVAGDAEAATEAGDEGFAVPVEDPPQSSLPGLVDGDASDASDAGDTHVSTARPSADDNTTATRPTPLIRIPSAEPSLRPNDDSDDDDDKDEDPPVGSMEQFERISRTNLETASQSSVTLRSYGAGRATLLNLAY